MANRPFRAPHHSSSLIALVGGGGRVKPGEISLAHRGVLFLDELPEFARPTLEALRQPLETGNITIARANQHITYPADIQLIAAMNPCRCGYYGMVEKECSRAPKCARDYQSKISGPLLDRFDLVVYVPPVPVEDLIVSASGKAKEVESSADIQKRVLAAVELKKQNQNILPKIEDLSSETQKFLRAAIEKMQISARGCYRIINVAQTIAYLSGEKHIASHHLAESLQYRYSLMEHEFVN